MASEWPRITIVTPSLNQGEYLRSTLDSVLSQNYPNLEYFVIDGGSTDRSVEIIRAYSGRLNGWVSEPDTGQTDAIAKGFERATGEIFNWLNSDDLLLPGALFAVAREFNSSGANLIIGKDRHFRKSPQEPVKKFEPSGYSYPKCVRFWTGEFKYHQPCTFFSRDIYFDAGGLDRSLHYVMDYDLYCRLLMQSGLRVEYLTAELSAFRLHKRSKTSTAKSAFLKEQFRVSQRYWPEEYRTDPDIVGQVQNYVTECQVHNFASALKEGRLREALQCLAFLKSGNATHAAAYTFLRLLKRFRPSDSKSQ